MLVEPLVDNPRLDADLLVAGGDHAAEMAGEVEDQALSQRFSGQSRTGTAGVERDLLLRRVLNAGHDVGRRARPDHAQRSDLVNAGVAGEQLQEHVVATDLSVDEAPQVVLDAFALLIEKAHQCLPAFAVDQRHDLRPG